MAIHWGRVAGIRERVGDRRAGERGVERALEARALEHRVYVVRPSLAATPSARVLNTTR